MNVTLPNGTVLNGIPEGTSKEAIKQKAISSGIATAADFGGASQSSKVWDIAEKQSGLVPTKDLLTQVVNPNRGFAEGLKRFGAGAKQLGLQAGEGSGLLSRGTTENFTGKELARQAKANETLSGVPGQNVSMMAGETGPYLAIPGSPGVLKNALTGTAVGGAMFSDSNTGKLKNAAKGGVLGGVLGKLSTPQTITGIKNKVLDISKKLGYKVPPAQANPTKINQMLEGGIAGEAKTAVKLAKDNQGVTDRLAKKAIGLRESEPISYETLDEVRRVAGKTYKKLASYTDEVRVDPEYFNDLKMIVKPQAKGADAFGGAGNKQIIALAKKYGKPTFSPKDAVKEIKKLRFNSKTRMRSMDNPEIVELGMAEREVADTIESMLERDLAKSGNTSLIKEFRESRKTIAKSYTIEDALNPGTGSIDAHKIAAMARKSKGKRVPMDGELKNIADFANQFRSSSQMLRRSGTDYSVFDTGASLVASAATKNPMLAAMPVLRPAVRSAITSKPYQALMTNPGRNNVLPGLLNKSPSLIGPGMGLLNQERR